MSCALQPLPFVCHCWNKAMGIFFWFKPLPSSLYVHSSPRNKKKIKKKKKKKIYFQFVFHMLLQAII